MAEKLVHAYSGGLNTSVTVRWIKDRYDVIPLAVNTLSFEHSTKPFRFNVAAKATTQTRKSK